MNCFQNKVAIITGGGSGIGREVCLQLARAGAQAVVAADINGEGAQQTARAIAFAGVQGCAAQVDVTQETAVQQLVDETVAEHGRLDYMFNNAGISIVGDMRDMTTDYWRQIIDANLWGVIHGVSSAYPVMVRQGSGHIVNTSSMAGLFPASISTAYAATKHAVVGLSTSLRAEAANLGIRVSVACPATVKTPILNTLTTITQLEEGASYPDLASYGAIEAGRCARMLLRGVARNRAIIPIGLPAHLLWRIYRLWPGFVIRLFQAGAAAFQKTRA